MSAPGVRRFLVTALVLLAMFWAVPWGRSAFTLHVSNRSGMPVYAEFFCSGTPPSGVTFGPVVYLAEGESRDYFYPENVGAAGLPIGVYLLRSDGYEVTFPVGTFIVVDQSSTWANFYGPTTGEGSWGPVFIEQTSGYYEAKSPLASGDSNFELRRYLEVFAYGFGVGLLFECIGLLLAVTGLMRRGTGMMD